MYRIDIARLAEADLTLLTRRDQVVIRASPCRLLQNEPGAASRARRPMRPNALGVPWALHVGDFRVYYDIDEDEQVVRDERVGYKPGSVLFLRGKPFDLG